MLQSRVKKNLLGAAIAVAAALGATGSVQAALYTGSWDPPYGAYTIFPNLGWKGTSTFSIPDTCAVGTATVPVTCKTAGFAQVDLYELGNPSHNEILNFNWTGSDFQMVFNNAGQLIGVDSGLFAPLPATLSQAGSGYYSFSLQFSSLNGAKLYYSENPRTDSDESEVDIDSSTLKKTQSDDSGSVCNYPITSAGNTENCGVNDFVNYPARVHYALVPEPATYALVLAALGALGLTMRRRRQ